MIGRGIWKRNIKQAFDEVELKTIISHRLNKHFLVTKDVEGSNCFTDFFFYLTYELAI